MNVKLLLTIALVVASVVLLAVNWRSQSPQHYAAHKTWHFQCLECNAKCTLTTEQIDAMVKHGEVIDRPHKERRFKCPKCGKIGLATPQGALPEIPHETAHSTQ